jgi:hypothetical protein
MAGLSELIPTIAAKTEQGKLKWEAVGDSFVVIFDEDVGVRLSKKVSPVTSYTAALVDKQGNNIEIVRGNTGILAGLYEAARRNALSIDKKLDVLRKKLDSL